MESYEQFRQLVQWRVLDYQRVLHDSFTREMYVKYGMDPVMYDYRQLRRMDTLHDAAVNAAIIGGATVLIQGSLMYNYMMITAGAGIVYVPVAGKTITYITAVSPVVLELIIKGAHA